METLRQFSEKERAYHEYQARQNYLREQGGRAAGEGGGPARERGGPAREKRGTSGNRATQGAAGGEILEPVPGPSPEGAAPAGLHGAV
jgi:hypothetical protein